MIAIGRLAVTTEVVTTRLFWEENDAVGAKVLVIATDITRFMTVEGGESLTSDWSFFEPSAGAGAVAMIVSELPFS